MYESKNVKTVWQLNNRMRKRVIHSHVDVLIAISKPNLALWCVPQVPASQEADRIILTQKFKVSLSNIAKLCLREKKEIYNIS